MSQLTVDARDPVHRWTWRKFHHLHDFNHFRSAGSLPLTAIHQRFPSKNWHFPATFGRISSNVNTFCDNEAFGTLLTWIFKHQEQKATESLRPAAYLAEKPFGRPNCFPPSSNGEVLQWKRLAAHREKLWQQVRHFVENFQFLWSIYTSIFFQHWIIYVYILYTYIYIYVEPSPPKKRGSEGTGLVTKSCGNKKMQVCKNQVPTAP